MNVRGQERRPQGLSRSFAPVLLAALVALAATPSHADRNGSVVFTIDHVRDDAGHVRVDICTRDTFLQGGCPYFGSAPAVKGVTTVVIEDVPPGVYAAQAYHDRNDNHKVDMRLHIPIEGVGFSNNAPIGLYGPKFDVAAFAHDTTDQTLAVRLRHFV